jgi:hypothetical protein
LLFDAGSEAGRPYLRRSWKYDCQEDSPQLQR